MTDLAITNTFATGTTAVAADVNENFQDIVDFVNTTGVPKVQDGIVGGNALGVPYIGQVSSPLTSVVSGDGNKVLSGAGSALIETNPTNGLDVDATTSRVTAKATGLYRLDMFATYSILRASATIKLGYAKNGTHTGIVYQFTNPAAADATGPLPMASTIISLTANDYLQATAFNSSVNSTGVTAYLTLTYLGPSS